MATDAKFVHQRHMFKKLANPDELPPRIDAQRPESMQRSKHILLNRLAASRGISEQHDLAEHTNNLRALKFKSKANIHVRQSMLKRPASAMPHLEMLNRDDAQQAQPPLRSARRRQEQFLHL